MVWFDSVLGQRCFNIVCSWEADAFGQKGLVWYFSIFERQLKWLYEMIFHATSLNVASVLDANVLNLLRLMNTYCDMVPFLTLSEQCSTTWKNMFSKRWLNVVCQVG